MNESNIDGEVLDVNNSGQLVRFTWHCK